MSDIPKEDPQDEVCLDPDNPYHFVGVAYHDSKPCDDLMCAYCNGISLVWKPCEFCWTHEGGRPCANCHTNYLDGYDKCDECDKYAQEINCPFRCCPECQNKIMGK